MKITVQREAGDRPAPETLVDPLCTSSVPALEKGKAFLYDNGYNKKNFTITIPLRFFKFPGAIIEVHDTSINDVFKARLSSYSLTARHGGDGVVLSQTMMIERSLDVE